MTRTVKVGIIGCGGIANGKHMPSLSKQKNGELAAFCDGLIERAGNSLDVDEAKCLLSGAAFDDGKVRVRCRSRSSPLDW